MDDFAIILGARGSIPVSGRDYSAYGGATTCVLLRLGGAAVLLDAGTGLLRLPDWVLEQRELPLLLTHPHLDHLLGLPMCSYLVRSGRRLDIYAAPRGGLDTEAQIRRLLSPPLWPIGPDKFPAALQFHSLEASMDLGGLHVDALEGCHPGGVSVLRISGGGRRVVLATDCTLTPRLLPALQAFSRDCDLLLIDGQYSPAEWESRSGYGHNTWDTAACFGRDCGARQIRILHHDPAHTDAFLDLAAQELHQIYPNCDFAHEGEVVQL